MHTSLLAASGKLLFFLQQRLNKASNFVKVQLKGPRLCFKRTLNGNRIALIEENGSKYFHGTIPCRNTWACPICTPRKMGKLAHAIGLFLEHAKKKLGLKACMVTFTIPHWHFLTCKDIMSVLYSSWKRFNKLEWFRKHVKPLYTHYVKVTELTYGQNGWHPHFHCLFWSKDISKWGDNELTIRHYWLNIVRDELDSKCRDILFAKYGKNYVNSSEWQQCSPMLKDIIPISDKNEIGVHVSRNSNGNVSESEASAYICGWGADKEVTGNFNGKATAENHYTPFQLLEMSQFEPKYFNKFLEYAIGTKGFHHYRFSHTGILSIIKKLWQQDQCEEFLKKNTSAAKVICWFTSDEWYLINEIEYYHKFPMRFYIIELSDDAQLLQSYLLSFGIDIRRRRPISIAA